MSNQYQFECAEGGYALTKGTDYTDNPFRYLWVGTAGDLIVTTKDGSVLTLANASVGYHWVKGTKVDAASGAADITAFV